MLARKRAYHSPNIEENLDVEEPCFCKGLLRLADEVLVDDREGRLLREGELRRLRIAPTSDLGLDSRFDGLGGLVVHASGYVLVEVGFTTGIADVGRHRLKHDRGAVPLHRDGRGAVPKRPGRAHGALSLLSLASVESHRSKGRGQVRKQ